MGADVTAAGLDHARAEVARAVAILRGLYAAKGTDAGPGAPDGYHRAHVVRERCGQALHALREAGYALCPTPDDAEARWEAALRRFHERLTALERHHDALEAKSAT